MTAVKAGDLAAAESLGRAATTRRICRRQGRSLSAAAPHACGLRPGRRAAAHHSPACEGPETDSLSLGTSCFPVPSADLTYDDVKNAYLGGTNNQQWKDPLLELSLHPGEEVFWPDLCEAVGYNRKVMSGVIGAGERRTKDKRPYSKRYAGDDT